MMCTYEYAFFFQGRRFDSSLRIDIGCSVDAMNHVKRMMITMVTMFSHSQYVAHVTQL